MQFPGGAGENTLGGLTLMMRGGSGAVHAPLDEHPSNSNGFGVGPAPADDAGRGKSPGSASGSKTGVSKHGSASRGSGNSGSRGPTDFSGLAGLMQQPRSAASAIDAALGAGTARRAATGNAQASASSTAGRGAAASSLFTSPLPHHELSMLTQGGGGSPFGAAGVGQSTATPQATASSSQHDSGGERALTRSSRLRLQPTSGGASASHSSMFGEACGDEGSLHPTATQMARTVGISLTPGIIDGLGEAEQSMLAGSKLGAQPLPHQSSAVTKAWLRRVGRERAGAAAGPIDPPSVNTADESDAPTVAGSSEDGASESVGGKRISAAWAAPAAAPPSNTKGGRGQSSKRKGAGVRSSPSSPSPSQAQLTESTASETAAEASGSTLEPCTAASISAAGSPPATNQARSPASTLQTVATLAATPTSVHLTAAAASVAGAAASGGTSEKRKRRDGEGSQTWVSVAPPAPLNAPAAAPTSALARGVSPPATALAPPAARLRQARAADSAKMESKQSSLSGAVAPPPGGSVPQLASSSQHYFSSAISEAVPGTALPFGYDAATSGTSGGLESAALAAACSEGEFHSEAYGALITADGSGWAPSGAAAASATDAGSFAHGGAHIGDDDHLYAGLGADDSDGMPAPAAVKRRGRPPGRKDSKPRAPPGQGKRSLKKAAAAAAAAGLPFDAAGYSDAADDGPDGVDHAAAGTARASKDKAKKSVRFSSPSAETPDERGYYPGSGYDGEMDGAADGAYTDATVPGGSGGGPVFPGTLELLTGSHAPATPSIDAAAEAPQQLDPAAGAGGDQLFSGLPQPYAASAGLDLYGGVVPQLGPNFGLGDTVISPLGVGLGSFDPQVYASAMATAGSGSGSITGLGLPLPPYSSDGSGFMQPPADSAAAQSAGSKQRKRGRSKSATFSATASSEETDPSVSVALLARALTPQAPAPTLPALPPPLPTSVPPGAVLRLSPHSRYLRATLASLGVDAPDLKAKNFGETPVWALTESLRGRRVAAVIAGSMLVCRPASLVLIVAPPPAALLEPSSPVHVYAVPTEAPGASEGHASAVYDVIISSARLHPLPASGVDEGYGGEATVSLRLPRHFLTAARGDTPASEAAASFRLLPGGDAVTVTATVLRGRCSDDSDGLPHSGLDFTVGQLALPLVKATALRSYAAGVFDLPWLQDTASSSSAGSAASGSPALELCAEYEVCHVPVLQDSDGGDIVSAGMDAGDGIGGGDSIASGLVDAMGRRGSASESSRVSRKTPAASMPAVAPSATAVPAPATDDEAIAAAAELLLARVASRFRAPGSFSGAASDVPPGFRSAVSAQVRNALVAIQTLADSCLAMQAPSHAQAPALSPRDSKQAAIVRNAVASSASAMGQSQPSASSAPQESMPPFLSGFGGDSQFVVNLSRMGSGHSAGVASGASAFALPPASSFASSVAPRASRAAPVVPALHVSVATAAPATPVLASADPSDTTRGSLFSEVSGGGLSETGHAGASRASEGGSNSSATGTSLGAKRRRISPTLVSPGRDVGQLPSPAATGASHSAAPISSRAAEASPRAFHPISPFGLSPPASGPHASAYTGSHGQSSISGLASMSPAGGAGGHSNGPAGLQGIGAAQARSAAAAALARARAAESSSASSSGATGLDSSKRRITPQLVPLAEPTQRFS